MPMIACRYSGNLLTSATSHLTESAAVTGAFRYWRMSSGETAYLRPSWRKLSFLERSANSTRNSGGNFRCMDTGGGGGTE
jgi:hypothetical protein